MSLSWPDSAYLVNERLQFVYCPIPKVASSSLKQWFLTTLGYEPGTPAWPKRPHLFLSEWLQRRRAGVPNDFFAFAFVRDPRRRLVSAFLQKFVVRWDVPDSPARPVIRAICESVLRPVDYANGVSFRCFVRHVVAQDPMALDVHWRPQHLFLDGLQRPIDFLGHVESFDADMATLMQRLSMAKRESFRTLQLPYSTTRIEGAADMTSGQLRRLKAFPAWQSFYDDDLRSQVSDFYAEDDQRFGYSVSPETVTREEQVVPC